MSDSQDNENGAISPRPTVEFIFLHTVCTVEVELDPTLDFLAGTVAGVSGLVVGFPFDTGA